MKGSFFELVKKVNATQKGSHKICTFHFIDMSEFFMSTHFFIHT